MLAALTLEDQVLGVLQSRGLVEAVPECFGHQGSRGGVVPALALVDVEEDLDPFALLDASLEHAHRAALDELVVDDAVGGRASLHMPGFGFVEGELTIFQEGKDWLSPGGRRHHREDGRRDGIRDGSS